MRLGSYPAKLTGAPSSPRPTARRGSPSGTGTATRSTTPTASSSRRPGWSSAARSPDGTLVEFVELPREVHPYYVSTQAHPEFKSRPHRAHPLFAGLVGAAIERAARVPAGRGRASRGSTAEAERRDRRRPACSARRAGRPRRAARGAHRGGDAGLVWDVVRDRVDLGEAGEVRPRVRPAPRCGGRGRARRRGPALPDPAVPPPGPRVRVGDPGRPARRRRRAAAPGRGPRAARGGRPDRRHVARPG